MDKNEFKEFAKDFIIKETVTKDSESVKKAIEHLNKKYLYGELIPHYALRNLSGLFDNPIELAKEIDDPIIRDRLLFAAYKSREYSYSRFLEFVKDIMLKEHKKAMRSNFAQGYNIVHPIEQALFAKQEFINRVTCGANKADRIMKNTNTDSMSPLAYQSHKAKVDLMRGTIYNVNKALGKMDRAFTDIEEKEGRPVASPTIDKLRGKDEKRKAN